MNRVQFERACQSRNVHVAKRRMVVEGPTARVSVRVKTFNSDIPSPGCEARNPLVGQRTQGYPIGVGITDANANPAVRGNLDEMLLIFEEALGGRGHNG